MFSEQKNKAITEKAEAILGTSFYTYYNGFTAKTDNALQQLISTHFFDAFWNVESLAKLSVSNFWQNKDKFLEVIQDEQNYQMPVRFRFNSAEIFEKSPSNFTFSLLLINELRNCFKGTGFPSAKNLSALADAVPSLRDNEKQEEIKHISYVIPAALLTPRQLAAWILSPETEVIFDKNTDKDLFGTLPNAFEQTKELNLEHRDSVIAEAVAASHLNQFDISTTIAFFAAMSLFKQRSLEALREPILELANEIGISKEESISR